MRDIDRHLRRGERIEVAYALRDIHRLVADTLEIGIDLDHGQNEAQIDGHWLLHREQVQRHLVDLALQPVDRQFAMHHQVADRSVARAIGFNRALDRLLGHAGHHKELFLQLVQALMKPYAHQCTSPKGAD